MKHLLPVLLTLALLFTACAPVAPLSDKPPESKQPSAPLSEAQLADFRAELRAAPTGPGSNFSILDGSLPGLPGVQDNFYTFMVDHDDANAPLFHIYVIVEEATRLVQYHWRYVESGLLVTCTVMNDTTGEADGHSGVSLMAIYLDGAFYVLETGQPVTGYFSRLLAGFPTLLEHFEAEAAVQISQLEINQ